MNEIFKLFGTIGLNNSEANKGIDETTGKAQNASGKIAGFFKKAAVAIGTVFAAGKLIDFGKTAVEAAAGAKAIQAQFEQVFGDLQGESLKAIDAMAKEFGMVSSRLKPSMTKMTSMFKGLGMDTEEAMGKATDAVRLSADAAAFYDVSYESANQSLTSFIKGNYEGGEAIGIFANETQMAQFAIQKGLVGSTTEWSALDEATKQATRLEYAQNMQELGGATGQASREADGFENVMGNVKQAWQDFLALVGGPILEPVVTALQRVTEWLQQSGGKVQEFQGWFAKLRDEVANSTAFQSLQDVIGDLVDKFRELKESFGNSQLFADMKQALSDLKDIILEIDFRKLIDDVSEFLDKWGPLIAGILGAVATFKILATVIPVVVSAFKAFSIIKSLITSVGLLQTAFAFLAPVIGAISWPVVAVAAVIGVLIAAGVALYKNWDKIKAKATEVWGNLVTFFSQTWESIKTNASSAWEGIKAVALSVWNAIGGVISIVVNAIVTVVSTGFNSVKNSVTVIFNAIRSVASSVWNAINTVITNVVNSISSGVTSGFNAVKSAVTSIFNAIRSTASSIWDGIKSTVVNIANSVKSGVSSAFNSLKSTVTSIWNGIKDAISRPINAAKDAVKSAIDRMKSFFNFSWSLPPLKIPKISISGGFSLKPLSVPSFGISWHKDGGIFEKATLFDTASGMHGVGEAGPEAVLPLNRETLGGIGEGIAASMGWGNDYIAEKLDAIIDLLINFFTGYNPNAQVVMDTGALVGAIKAEMSRQLGNDINLRGRGR
ncbi:TPA: hypothetical protein ACGO46_001628 [Streptococcus suis]